MAIALARYLLSPLVLHAGCPARHALLFLPRGLRRHNAGFLQPLAHAATFEFYHLGVVDPAGADGYCARGGHSQRGVSRYPVPLHAAHITESKLLEYILQRPGAQVLPFAPGETLNT